MIEVVSGYSETVQNRLEYWRGEGLKSVAELALSAGQFSVGGAIIERFNPDGEVFEDEVLRTEVAGLEFSSPLIVGAGWDKRGRCVDGFERLGFGGVVVGTVLAYPQTGNPKPRLWTIDDNHSVGLNRLGFNSPGMDSVRERLTKRRSDIVVLASAGKNKLIPNGAAPEMHAAVVDTLYDVVDGFEHGVSSPNTEGLRELQDNLSRIFKLSNEAMDRQGERKPTWAKITMDDMTDDRLKQIIEVVQQEGTGIATSNTTVDSELKAKYGERWRDEAGGLSGNDPSFYERAVELVGKIHEFSGGEMPIIGLGGVNSAERAINMLEAGASLVGVVTAIREKKTALADEVNKGLVRRVRELGLTSVGELVGRAA